MCAGRAQQQADTRQCVTARPRQCGCLLARAATCIHAPLTRRPPGVAAGIGWCRCVVQPATQEIGTALLACCGCCCCLPPPPPRPHTPVQHALHHIHQAWVDLHLLLLLNLLDTQLKVLVQAASCACVDEVQRAATQEQTDTVIC